MEELISEIVTKVREMYKYDHAMKDIVAQTATMYASEDKETGKFKIDYIKFDYYDIITVSATEIAYHPEFGPAKTLFRYSGWDALLNL